MEFSFSYTLDDYREAARAVRKPQRSPPHTRKARLVLILTAILCAALLITGVVSQSHDASGEPQATRTSEFLIGLIPWVLVFGALWSVVLRSANPLTQEASRRPVLILFLAGICFTIVDALKPISSAPPAPLREVAFNIVPWIILLIGCVISLATMLRTIRRKMWDGMPHLQLPHKARFTDERAEFENTNALCSYRWPAFVIFRETPNLFVLQTSQYTFHMFPKRACRDGAQIDELRRLIEKNVPNAQPVSFGFAVVAPKAPPPLPRMVESLPPRRMY